MIVSSSVAPLAALLSPAFGFKQADRLLTLAFMPGSGIDDNILLPHELTGHESISAGFTFTLTCLSSDAFLELKTFIGTPS